jgi:hypothetical protein
VVVPYVLVSIPMDNPYFMRDFFWQDLGLTGLVSLFILGSAVAYLLSATRGRQRHRQRLAALRGDWGAMPLAEIRVDPALAPDLTKQPLELLWRTRTSDRVVYVPLLGLQALVALVSIGLMIVELIIPIFASPQPVSVTELALRVALAALVVAIVVALIAIVTRVLPYVFGRPFGVVATESGIDARTVQGTRVHLGWDEMRLLEAVRGDAGVTRRYALYAPGKRIDWTEYATGYGAQYAPVGATAAQMTLLQAALLNLIAARTGLVPRTLVKALQHKPAPAQGKKRASPAVGQLVSALILASSAAAAYFFPPTPVPWINWLGVGSLSITTLLFVATSLWEAFARTPLPAHASPPSVGAPSLEAPGAAYVFRWRIPLVRRLGVLFAGLSLAVNLVEAAYIFLLQFGAMPPGFQSQIHAEDIFANLVHFVLAIIFAMIGVLGLALLYAGLRATAVRVQADKDGLKSTSGTHQQLLVWSSILSISWGPGGGERLAYHVQSDTPYVQISWPAGSRIASVDLPGDGALPIGPDELAALVAARIGKPIEVGR